MSSALQVVDIHGKKIESIDLPEAIFGGKVNKDVLYQASIMYQAAQRQGTASTKERGAVSGGGKKPWRQKGTGRARAGSSRSPLWHGGGVVFGPHPREHRYSIPKKVRTIALRESLNAKFLSENLVCVDQLEFPSGKTKDFSKMLNTLKLSGRVLTLLSDKNSDVVKVARNVACVSLLRADDVNAYDVLSNKTVLVTKDSFNKLLKRIK